MSVDPEFVGKLAGIQARTRARSTEIYSDVQAKRDQIVAESGRRRLANEEFCTALDRQVEERATSRVNAGLASRVPLDDENDFGFEDDEAPGADSGHPAAAQPPAPVPPLPPAPSPRAAPPSAPNGRPVRRAPVEEDDYAETDWTSD